MTTSPSDATRTLELIQQRFESHMHRHSGLDWALVRERLRATPAAVHALHAMESSGGEPDVIAQDPATGQYLFCDCSPESPSGRRSFCYDGAARVARKQNAPADSALEVAARMGIGLLTEQEYRMLQQLDAFDTKTSSWISTPPDVRGLGGALFCDRRYGRVFVYHNGADSYYAARGFRGALRV